MTPTRTVERKRANGAGSVEVLPDGRARIRVHVDGKKRQVGPYLPDEETAHRYLRAWTAARTAGEIEAPLAMTLGAFGTTWLDEREIHGSRVREQVKNVSGERSVWSRHVVSSELAKLPLTAIRSRDIEAFALWLRSRKAVAAITKGTNGDRRVEHRTTTRSLSRQTQKHALRLVRACLEEAVRQERIATNPAAGVRVARGASAGRDISEDWLRADEISKLLTCEAISLRDRTLYATAIGTGIRLDDLKRIEVAHVHLDAEGGPYIALEIAKSAKHHRVPVLPWLMPWMRNHLATLPKDAKWLFPNREGLRFLKSHDFGWAAPQDARRARQASALERAGVARRIRFHDLRGSTATHLALGTFGRRWSLFEIQQFLAHSDQRVTERYVRRATNALAIAAAETRGSPASAA